MTVEEYANKFIELLRFAPLIAKDEKVKCKRFEEGLQGKIRIPVTAMVYTEFRKLVEAAMWVERSLAVTERTETVKYKYNMQGWLVCGPSNKMPKRENSFSKHSGNYRQRQGLR